MSVWFEVTKYSGFTLRNTDLDLQISGKNSETEETGAWRFWPGMWRRSHHKQSRTLRWLDETLKNAPDSVALRMCTCGKKRYISATLEMEKTDSLQIWNLKM